MAAFPFVPNNEEEEEEEEEELNGTEKSQVKKLKDDNKPDPDVARYDVVKVSTELDPESFQENRLSTVLCVLLKHPPSCGCWTRTFSTRIRTLSWLLVVVFLSYITRRIILLVSKSVES